MDAERVRGWWAWTQVRTVAFPRQDNSGDISVRTPHAGLGALAGAPPHGQSAQRVELVGPRRPHAGRCHGGPAWPVPALEQGSQLSHLRPLPGLALHPCGGLHRSRKGAVSLRQEAPCFRQGAGGTPSRAAGVGRGAVRHKRCREKTLLCRSPHPQTPQTLVRGRARAGALGRGRSQPRHRGTRSGDGVSGRPRFLSDWDVADAKPRPRPWPRPAVCWGRAGHPRGLLQPLGSHPGASRAWVCAPFGPGGPRGWCRQQEHRGRGMGLGWGRGPQGVVTEGSRGPRVLDGQGLAACPV